MAPRTVGRPTELLLPVPTEDEDYAPCFSLRVFGPPGHFVDAPPACLARMNAAATIRALDGPGGVLGRRAARRGGVAAAAAPRAAAV
jgi:hypothetical protein